MLAIAAIYGVEDKFKDQEIMNNSLMFTTEDKLHAYFEEEKQMAESRRQMEVYRDKG